jgi:hypothetical protein
MMDDSELDAFARGMVPFVRKAVAEATAVPPELAEQIASAVRLLHESPAIEQRNEAPRPRITSIGRDADGNFVPVYDDQPV